MRGKVSATFMRGIHVTLVINRKTCFRNKCVFCICFQIDAKTGMVMNLTDLKKCIEVTFFPLMEFKNWLIFTQKNRLVLDCLA